MRVLQIIDSLHRGGAEVMLTGMAPRFRERGLTCDVVALLRTPSPLEHLLERKDVNLRYTGVQRLYSPRQISPLAKLLRGYDIAHVHLFPAQLWAVVAAARLKPSHPFGYHRARHMECSPSLVVPTRGHMDVSALQTHCLHQ